MAPRKIIHVDMDCFYAAVEARDNPAYRGRPLAVGGTPQQRGVVCTCSYEARKFGIRSGMASARALALCPSLILLPPDFPRYKEASAGLHEIISRYTDRIEPLSLDEAFLDVSGRDACRGSATLMAREILASVTRELALTASAGVAPNKLLAKLASEVNKPRGLFVVPPEQVEAFMPGVPVSNLFGVGRVTGERLARLGLRTCGDLQTWSREELIRVLGRLGDGLYFMCRGIDEREVSNSRVRRSLSVEETFSQDITGLRACGMRLPELRDRLVERLTRFQARGEREIAGCFLKVKFEDFTQTTAQTRGPDTELAVFESLLPKAWSRGMKPVRLLGIGVYFRDESDLEFRQLTLPLAGATCYETRCSPSVDASFLSLSRSLPEGVEPRVG